MSEVILKPKTFFDLFPAGQVTANEADDFIDWWHGSGNEEQRPLTEYLGMTDKEYSLWMMDRRILPEIATGHRTGGLSLVMLMAEQVRVMPAANAPDRPHRPVLARLLAACPGHRPSAIPCIPGLAG